LEIFDESANPTDIGPTSSSFSAPHWTPTGIFYLGPDGVTLRADDGGLDVLSDASGFVGINPNPQGSLVAIHSLSGQGGVTVGLQAQEEEVPNAVSILDLESGEVESVATGLSIGSFWSPAGTRLLILEVNADARAVDLVVWEAGETRTLTTLEVPGSLITETLAFFDQYAQSWRVWSPDSNAIVLPGTIGDATGIWVVGVGGADPMKIADGDWAAWSHG
jgi:TolB protein